MSLYLPEQKLGSRSTEGATSNKFMLKGRQTGAMHRGHSWVFRAESFETMAAWYEDIKMLTEKSPQERNAFVRQHARSVSGSSQKASSVSSDGAMDEEDEEPFSSTTSAIVGGPKQDVLPRRPQGGRFPSKDLIVSAQRGLQAPLSPSSGSSGFADVQDRDVIAAAGALPGSGVGRQYGEDDLSSPTHAERINQFAKEDKVNPYTYETLPDHHALPESHFSTSQAAATGLGGAVLGAAGSELYRKHGEEASVSTPDDYRQQQEHQAAIESPSIAAPDTYQQRSEQQAAIEAAIIAAPDTLAPIPSDSKFMFGGRSTGDLASQNVPNPLETLTSDPLRPTLAAGQNHLSVHSISQLHVPGEFPKGSVS